MKKIVLRASKQSLSIQDISDFENKYKIILPLNYKKFIQKYNGGLTDDNDDVKLFKSIKYGNNLIEKTIDIHQIIEKNIPRDYLPIAIDWSGNPITICVTQGNKYGKIIQFYFDTGGEPEIIADSLEELLGVNSIDEL